jgi:hypothetical protein
MWIIVIFNETEKIFVTRASGAASRALKFKVPNDPI